MLDKIAKRDVEWRKIALKICGCKSLADDLVNDMYIKIYKLKPTKFNTSYISYTIYHLFLNHLKKESKTIYLDETYLNIIDEDNEDVLDRKIINKALDELSFADREILLHTHERSLRKNVDHLGISIRTLQYGKNKGIEKLKLTKAIKELNRDRQ
jgi:RNA polymerase sigma factor (sigma-70 family)